MINYNPSGLDAAMAYGVQLERMAAVPSTATDPSSPSSSTVGGDLLGHTAIHSHPLFYLLIFVLLFVGYVGFLFDFQIKKIVDVKAGAGSKS